MKLKDFEALANKLGMVPMVGLVDVTGHRKGKIYGYLPEVAQQGYESGLLGIYNGKGKKPTTARAVKEGDEEEENPPVVTSKNLPGAPKIAIPDDWETMHHLKRINLAAQIQGVEAREIGTDGNAKAIIAGELVKRRGAGA